MILIGKWSHIFGFPPRALLGAATTKLKMSKLAYHDNTNLCQAEFLQCLKKHPESIEKKIETKKQWYFASKLSLENNGDWGKSIILFSSSNTQFYETRISISPIFRCCILFFSFQCTGFIGIFEYILITDYGHPMEA